MDEMNNLPENQNNEEIKEQYAPMSQNAKAKKLPIIIGGVIAAVVILALLLGGESHEHSYGAWETVDEPTCSSAGIEERVCDCGEAETRSIAMLSHTLGAWSTTNEATCAEQGSKKRTCECGYQETDTIAATGNHSFGDWITVTEATMVSAGTLYWLTTGEAFFRNLTYPDAMLYRLVSWIRFLKKV